MQKLISTNLFTFVHNKDDPDINILKSATKVRLISLHAGHRGAGGGADHGILLFGDFWFSVIIVLEFSYLRLRLKSAVSDNYLRL